MRIARRARSALVAGVLMVAVACTVSPAHGAGSTGSVSGQVSYILRSISVSTPGATTPGTIPLTSCWGSYNEFANATDSAPGPGGHTQTGPATGWAEPNGFCISGISETSVSVTNGPISGHINVQGSDAAGVDGTGTLTLVGAQPGNNAFSAATYGRKKGVYSYSIDWPESAELQGQQLGTAAACDNAFNWVYDNNGNPPTTGCVAAANQVGTEDVGAVSSASHTGTATKYGFTVTWIAVA